MWWFSMIGLFVMAVPMYMLMGQSFGLAIVGFAVLGLLYIPQLSTISATFPAMFPAHVRFAGFAVTYNVFTSIFGGTAAPLNEAVVESTGFLEFPAVYVMLGCAVGMVALLFLKETAGASLHGTEIPESEPEDYGLEAIQEEDAKMDACGRCATAPEGQGECGHARSALPPADRRRSSQRPGAGFTDAEAGLCMRGRAEKATKGRAPGGG